MTRHPQWLADRIAANRRAATPHTCPRCGTPVYTGPDLDHGGLQVTVNAQSVTAYTLWPIPGTAGELHREWGQKHIEHECEGT